MATTVFPESGDQITEAAWTALNKALTVAERYRLNGYTLSAGTGLNADVAAGTCMVNGYYINSDATQAVSVTASQTNYIWLNEDGTLSANTTGTNPSNELLLGTAVTDGSGVTSVSHDYKIANQRNVYIVKASDETVNNSATLQDDDDFFFNVSDGEQWEVEVFLLAEAASLTPDMRIDFVASGGASIPDKLQWLQANRSTNSYQTDGIGNSVLTWEIDASGAEVHGYIRSYFFITGDGIVTMQWCQDVATAADTTIKADSWLIARRVIG